MISPYNWQLPSVERLVQILSDQQFALNASDTGTGKTIVALETLKRLKLPGLIVCPKQVHTAWLRAAAEMSCASQVRGVVNAERLQFKNPWFIDNKWTIDPGVLVIWDEVHRGASGPKSKTTRILATTKPQGIKVLAMSATVASSPLQMRAVGYLAGLHRFRNESYWPWCIQNGCFRKPSIPGLHFPKGPSAKRIMAQLGEQLRPCMVRVRIDEVPEFPETQILANLYDLDAKYTEEINAAYERMDEELKRPKSNPMTERLRARQVAELQKLPLLQDLVKEACEEGKAVVVFVNFRESLIGLREALSSIPLGWIWGGQANSERQGFLDGFAADQLQIMICMVQAGGVGINLHGLPGQRPRVSFLTPTERADEFRQCLGRIHRSGGTKTVQTLVLAAGTVEERVQKNVAGKLDNLSALQDGDLNS